MNRFVAGFIGSPAMNFVKAHVEGTRFVSDEVSLDANEELMAALKDYQGKEVWVGVRPENITVPSAENPVRDGNRIRAMVDVVEPLGAETHIIAKVGASSIVARVAPDVTAEAGEMIELVVEEDSLHAFDLENELNLRFL